MTETHDALKAIRLTTQKSVTTKTNETEKRNCHCEQVHPANYRGGYIVKKLQKSKPQTDGTKSKKTYAQALSTTEGIS